VPLVASPVLMMTTAMLPFVFLKAATFTLVGAPLAATMTALGRTYRENMAKAQSRPEAWTPLERLTRQSVPAFGHGPRFKVSITAW
jgi:hypothetical protein